MSETPNLRLPRLAAAQAQKHVTVNEALTRLDALVSPSVAGGFLATPPTATSEGDAYIVARGAGDVWTGRDDQLAWASAGGWEFAEPRAGMRVWLRGEGVEAVWSGSAWLTAPAGPVLAGAFSQMRVAVQLQSDLAGASVATPPVIPDRAIVFGVAARVIVSLEGSGLTGWSLGVNGAPGRYGSGIGLELNSSARGVTSAPVAYHADTGLLIEAEGGAFAGGAIRLAVHYMALTPPDPV